MDKIEKSIPYVFTVDNKGNLSRETYLKTNKDDAIINPSLLRKIGPNSYLFRSFRNSEKRMGRIKLKM